MLDSNTQTPGPSWKPIDVTKISTAISHRDFATARDFLLELIPSLLTDHIAKCNQLMFEHQNSEEGARRLRDKSDAINYLRVRDFNGVASQARPSVIINNFISCFPPEQQYSLCLDILAGISFNIADTAIEILEMALPLARNLPKIDRTQEYVRLVVIAKVYLPCVISSNGESSTLVDDYLVRFAAQNGPPTPENKSGEIAGRLKKFITGAVKNALDTAAYLTNSKDASVTQVLANVLPHETEPGLLGMVIDVAIEHVDCSSEDPNERYFRLLDLWSLTSGAPEDHSRRRCIIEKLDALEMPGTIDAKYTLCISEILACKSTSPVVTEPVPVPEKRRTPL